MAVLLWVSGLLSVGAPQLCVTFRLWRVTDRSHIFWLLTGNTPVKAKIHGFRRKRRFYLCKFANAPA
jgi:hypothetical protein